MADSQVSDPNETDQPPGTFKLIQENETGDYEQRIIVLDPVPSSDPNQPLNWSTTRKAVNFTIVLATTTLVFTAITIQSIFWQQMAVDLEVSLTQLNQTMSVNYVGLATGCIFFIPFVRKYGRRPVYIVSTALMLATTFWTSKIHTLAELYINNLLQSLAGATNESIAEITIADLFFVHHRGTMNGAYMSCVMIGNFLTPMAAGAQATRHGWRSSYQTMGIFNAILLLCFILLYEETKYVPLLTGRTDRLEEDVQEPPAPATTQTKDAPVPAPTQVSSVTEQARSHHVLDFSIPPRSWRQRLALVTPTPGPLWQQFYRPFTVLIFPAVAFTAFTYAAGTVWLTMLANVLSLTFPLPPYLFTPEQIGYTSAGPLVGNIFGAIYGGYLSDRSILYYARRNNGYYEPEMRLYLVHFPAIMMAGGLIMFGTTISRGMHWIYPNIAGAFFGFGVGSTIDVIMVLVLDSYQEITGEAFTAVTFVRNAVSIGIPFAIEPWMRAQGIQNVFIVCGVVSLAVSALSIPIIFWGKSARRAWGPRYRRMVDQQGSQ